MQYITLYPIYPDLTKNVLLREDVRLLRCIIDKLVSAAWYEVTAAFLFI